MVFLKTPIPFQPHPQRAPRTFAYFSFHSTRTASPPPSPKDTILKWDIQMKCNKQMQSYLPQNDMTHNSLNLKREFSNCVEIYGFRQRKLWPKWAAGGAAAAAKEKNFPHYFEMVYILSALQIIFICIPKIILLVLPLITTFTSSSCLFLLLIFFLLSCVGWSIFSGRCCALDGALESMLRDIGVTQRPKWFLFDFEKRVLT